jgi:hypothetical protein
MLVAPAAVLIVIIRYFELTGPLSGLIMFAVYGVFVLSTLRIFYLGKRNRD